MIIKVVQEGKTVTAAEEKKKGIAGERKSSALVILKLITKIKIK